MHSKKRKLFKPKKKKKKRVGICYVKLKDKRKKIPKSSSAKEEIGLKNLSSDDEWLAKGVD